MASATTRRIWAPWGAPLATTRAAAIIGRFLSARAGQWCRGGRSSGISTTPAEQGGEPLAEPPTTCCRADRCSHRVAPSDPPRGHFTTFVMPTRAGLSEPAHQTNRRVMAAQLDPGNARAIDAGPGRQRVLREPPSTAPPSQPLAERAHRDRDGSTCATVNFEPWFEVAPQNGPRRDTEVGQC
jgi:hypothetical protein